LPREQRDKKYSELDSEAVKLTRSPMLGQPKPKP